MHRHPVDGGVGGHHPQRAEFPDAGHPRGQEHLPQGALGDLHIAAFESAGRLSLPGVVAQAGHHLVGRGHAVTLGAPHDRLGDAGAEVRVFRKAFLVAAQAGVAVGLHHQGEQLVDAHGAGLGRRDGVDAGHQVHVPRAADSRALGKDGVAGSLCPVGALFAFEHRDSEARLLPGDLLEFVEVERLLARAFLQRLVREREEAAAGADGIHPGSGGETPAARLLGGDVAPELPHVHAGHVHLPELLLEGHAGEEFLDAAVDGGRLCARPGAVCQQCQCGARHAEHIRE